MWNDLVTTHNVKDLATQWMYEVVIDSNVRSEVFLHAVTVFDNFLDLCIVQTDQVQLCASACLILASKIRNDVLKDEQIIDYTDNSITKTELKVRVNFRLYFSKSFAFAIIFLGANYLQSVFWT